MTSKASEAEVPRLKPARRSRAASICAIILLLLAVLSILRLRNPELPPVILLPPGTAITHNPIPDRWIPRSWGWLWRARDAIFGRRTRVDFHAQIFHLTGPSLPAWLEQLPPPALATNRLRIWNLNAADFQNATAMMGGNKQDPLCIARIDAADGIVATAFRGYKVPISGRFADVGFRFEVLPQTHKQKTDVTLNVRWTELIVDHPASADPETTNEPPTLRTNIWQAARAQIPIGNGVVLMQAPDTTNPGVLLLLSIDRK
jgi:hypothetical protein